MSEEKLKLADEVKNDIIESEPELEGGQNLLMQRKREKIKQQIDDRTKNIFNIANKFLNKYGEDDYRTQMMMDFLYIADQIQDTIEIMDSIQEIELFFNDVMQLFDASAQLSQSLVKEQLQVNYGFFARWKMKREQKKAQKNNKYRVEMMMYRIESTIKSTTQMSQSMKDMMLSVRRSVEKTSKSLNEDRANKKNGGVSSGSSADVFKRYQAKYSQDGSNDGATGPSAPQGGTAPQGGASSDDSFGNILD